MNPNEKFQERLEIFVEGCNIISKSYNEKFGYNQDEEIVYKVNKRYTKLIKGRSVYCFVDNDNGDVLKSAGWNQPAKHARGNIFDEYNGLRTMGPHGAAYLKKG